MCAHVGESVVHGSFRIHESAHGLSEQMPQGYFDGRREFQGIVVIRRDHGHFGPQLPFDFLACMQQPYCSLRGQAQ